MRRYLRRLCCRTDGGAAVELGIIFPIFTILVLGMVEYGMVLFQMMNVSNAAQVGAQYAMLNGFNAANIQAAVTAATGLTSVTATETCGCSTGTSITTTTCGPPLPTCSSDGLTAGAYVTVTVQAPYTPVAPGIPSPLTAATLVRVQ